MPHIRTDGNCSDNGTVVLKVTFHSSRKVTKVEVMSNSHCQYFNEKAEKAGWKIEFDPAVRNGEVVTVVKTVQFTYHIH